MEVEIVCSRELFSANRRRAKLIGVNFIQLSSATAVCSSLKVFGLSQRHSARISAVER